jgi:hypothetical protein
MTMNGHESCRRRKRSAAAGRPRHLAQSRLQHLLAAAEVLERDAFGVKVARLPSDVYLKLFRRKRLLSSAAWRPYAQRFVSNANDLARLAVPTVRVRAYFRCPQAGRHVVAYQPLGGEVLRDRLRDGSAVDWPRLAQFVAHLHERGVYFRSLHSGNVVCVPGGGFGLIDIADLRVLRKPLGLVRRVRNLRPLLRDPALLARWQAAPFTEFIDTYCHAASVTARQESLLRRLAWWQWARCTGQGSGASASDSTSLTGSR